jgi:hypothetical protein
MTSVVEVNREPEFGDDGVQVILAEAHPMRSKDRLAIDAGLGHAPTLLQGASHVTAGIVRGSALETEYSREHANEPFSALESLLGCLVMSDALGKCADLLSKGRSPPRMSIPLPPFPKAHFLILASGDSVMSFVQDSMVIERAAPHPV